jgi:hypothetical protein
MCTLKLQGDGEGMHPISGYRGFWLTSAWQGGFKHVVNQGLVTSEAMHAAL